MTAVKSARSARVAADAVLVGAAALTVVALVVIGAVRRDAVGAVVAGLCLVFLAVPIVAAAVIRTAPRNPVGWILASTGLAFPLGAAAAIYARAGYAETTPRPGTAFAAWLDSWPWTFALVGVPCLGLLLFPDGALPSRRWRPVLWVGVAVVVTQLVESVFGRHLLDFPHRLNPTGLPGSAGRVADALFITIALVAPLATVSAWSIRLRRRRSPDDLALRLVESAAWLIAASWWTCWLVISATGSSDDALPAEGAGLVSLAVVGWVAIRRYGLWGAHQVVPRAAAHLGLSAVLVAIYFAVVALAALALPTAARGPVAVAVAALCALPLRTVVQRGVNRLFYGDRDDPYLTLQTLGRRIEDTVSPAQVVPIVAATAREALRLPFVSIETAESATTSGVRGDGPVETFPLVFAGEPIGTLTAETRDAGRPFTAVERQLLQDVARQAATAAHAVALNDAVLRSREQLITATAEERRRLRRDLHDGLGPSLASIVLGAHRAGSRLDPGSPMRQQLRQLAEQAQEAVADVRRIVYDLRPPALDELGLLGAITERAHDLGPITVEGPAELGTLPAAAEVAAYRIAVEAMTNSVRHARASSGWVRIDLDGALHLEIGDDGTGLPAEFRPGVGITSMRERAAEIGGTFVIESGHPRGTLVRAVLPLVAL
jgi:signal transduction histidine kinase